MVSGYTKVRALKAFAGAGVLVKKGEVIEFPNRWVDQYETRGFIARVEDKATYQTKVVKPETKETTPSGGLSDNHPYLETESDVETADVKTADVEVDDNPPEYEMLAYKDVLSVDDLEQRGPYYVLPSGKKVKGRKKAEKELANYYAEHESDN